MGGARYRANCLPLPREPFKRDTVDQRDTGATEEAGWVLIGRNLTLFSAHVHTMGESRHPTTFPAGPIKKSIGSEFKTGR